MKKILIFFIVPECSKDTITWFFLQTIIKNHSSNLKKFFIFKAKFVVFMQILFVMGFRSTNAVPVRHDKIFHSGLPERARSSSRMSMVDHGSLP